LRKPALSCSELAIAGKLYRGDDAEASVRSRASGAISDGSRGNSSHVKPRLESQVSREAARKMHERQCVHRTLAVGKSQVTGARSRTSGLARRAHQSRAARPRGRRPASASHGTAFHRGGEARSVGVRRRASPARGSARAERADGDEQHTSDGLNHHRKGWRFRVGSFRGAHVDEHRERLRGQEIPIHERVVLPRVGTACPSTTRAAQHFFGMRPLSCGSRCAAVQHPPTTTFSPVELRSALTSEKSLSSKVKRSVVVWKARKAAKTTKSTAAPPNSLAVGNFSPSPPLRSSRPPHTVPRTAAAQRGRKPAT
jgi:hypothetical protein